MKIKGNLVGFFISLFLSAFCMILIFMFSYQSAEQSSGISTSFYDIFIEKTGFEFITHNTFRKIAHFCEFSALGFCIGSTVLFYKNKPDFTNSFFICLMYAVSDEVHQLFVPERACRIFDVFVDSCGSLFGILMFFLLFFIYNKIRSLISKGEIRC